MRLTKKLESPYEKVVGENYVYTSETRLTPSFASVEQKLGQLEDIEEEQGIDLITLFKALSCGAWEKRKDNVLNFDDCKLLYKRIQIGSNVHWFSNYGITWALTKEELEK